MGCAARWREQALRNPRRRHLGRRRLSPLRSPRRPCLRRRHYRPDELRLPPRLRLRRRRLFLVFVAIDFCSIDDVELHVLQAIGDGLEDFWIDDIFRENLVKVVKGEVFLLLREFDQLTDFFLNFRSIDDFLAFCLWLSGSSFFSWSYFLSCWLGCLSCFDSWLLNDSFFGNLSCDLLWRGFFS